MSDSSADPADEEEHMICPSCHTPNASFARYCTACRAPLDSTTMLGPLGQIEAEGFALREATGGRSSPIIVAGIWLIFFPMLCAFGFLTTEFLLMDPDFSVGWLTGFLPSLAFTLFSTVLLYQTTTNFLRRRRERKKSNQASEPTASGRGSP